MQLNLDEKNGVAVIRIVGDIDINSSPEVKQSFDKLIKDKKNNVVINLDEVSYVDSSGLATLVEILKKLRTGGGKLKLSNLSAKVLGLFEITKLNKLFDITNDEDSAVNAFKAQG